MTTMRSARRRSPFGDQLGKSVNISVAVVDDGSVVGQGLREVLAVLPEIDLVHVFSTLPDLDQVSDYDVVVLGIHAPSGLRLLQWTQHLAARSRIVVLSNSSMLVAALVLLDAGAHGYLTLEAGDQGFRDAILRVAAGQSYLAAPVTELLRGATVPDALPHLTPREAEVLCHIGAGLTHVHTAHQLGVSVGTVETYIRRIRSRFAVDSPVQMIQLARQARVQRMLDRPIG